MARGQKPKYVFLTAARGVRVLPGNDTFERLLRQGLKAIGAGKKKPHTGHDLRDTFATAHLLQSSEKLHWVQNNLGHRHSSTTLDRYSKLVETSASADYANDLDRALEQPRPGKTARKKSRR
jgi:integrase